MKDFETELPNICSPAVQPMRSRDPAAIVAAIGKLAAPVPPDVGAELVALAFVHADAAVRKRATTAAMKLVADFAAFKAAYKTLANAPEHVIEDRLRAFDHPYRLGIAKSTLFHRKVAATIPFEQDAATRALILDAMVDTAKRDDEPGVQLGQVYWRWSAHGGWASYLNLHELPRGLFRELAARRVRHPFTGLAFHGGSLTTLPEEIALAAPWLTSLSLAYNPFTELPPVLWQLDHLEHLDLLGTELVDIPDDIAKLPKLRRLDIGNMKKMKAIPRSVCRLSKLERLRIGNGSIRTVPDDIAGMTSLRDFELQSTSVRKLPSCITKLPNLKTINVRWSKVPDATVAALKQVGVEVEQ
jgi:Leucine rich repeat